MKTRSNKTEKQVCRHPAAYLFFVCICLSLYGLFLWQGAEYASSLRRPTWRMAADQVIPTPSPAPIADDERIDLNTATAQELQALPGIGPVLSQAIVDYREEIGGFYYPEELLFVPGIGEKRLEAIQAFIVCPIRTAAPEN